MLALAMEFSRYVAGARLVPLAGDHSPPVVRLGPGPYVTPPALYCGAGSSHHEGAYRYPQSCTVCPMPSTRPDPVGHNRAWRSPRRGSKRSSDRLASDPRSWTTGVVAIRLLRKEVIQPHLPVRLPCYDFVPIAGSTFDGSLPKGLGHRLRVFPTFMT
jgi:hypothetical protein